MTEAKRDIPCPFLRALHRAGTIGDSVQLARIGDLVVRGLGLRGGKATRIHAATVSIAAIANGVASIPRNIRAGFRPHALRGGPVDKRGAGTRIYTQDGIFDAAELARFATFAKPYPAAAGATELGLGRRELRAYLDANSARAGGGWWARRVADGELPILLLMMGRGRGAERHLLVDEVATLFRDERLPDDVAERLRTAT